jgi:uncharacterized protein YggE
MDNEIIVKGRGQARSMPDRAVLDVQVEAEGATKEQAYNDAATSARQVDEVLSGRASAVDRVVTAVLLVHPKNRWRKGESIRTGWRAGRRTTVEVTDFSQLGELIAELTSAGGAVSGPAWRLDESNPVHRDARRLAAEDARRRAEDYATALGLKVGDVGWISEPGLRGQNQEDRFGGEIALSAASALAGEADEVIDVRPDVMTAVASVEIGFRLQQERFV